MRARSDRHGRLFRAYDRKVLTLPSEIVEAREVANRLSLALAATGSPPSKRAAFEEAVSATLRSLDPRGVDLSAALAAPAAVTAWDLRCRVLSAAADHAADDLDDVIRDLADRVVTVHVTGAGRELWKRVTVAVRNLRGVNLLDQDGLIAAPESVRKSYADLGALGETYDVLRAAYADVVPFTGQTMHDFDGDHSEVERGFCGVVPDYRRTVTAEARRWPWGDSSRERMAWFVRNDITPWWPTREARDRAYLAVHGDEVRRMQNQTMRGRMVHAMAD